MKNYLLPIIIKDRDLYITGDITTELAADIMSGIKEIIQLDVEATHFFKNTFKMKFTPPPINLHINSNGGSAVQGLVLNSFLKQCSTPIHTYNDGSCCSAAFTIFLGGKRRFAHKTSLFLYHNCYNASVGTSTANELKESAENLDKIQDFMVELLKPTKFPSSLLSKASKQDKDIIFFGEEALEYEIITHLL